MNKKETVLVLDDDELIANRLCETLEGAGFQAFDANSIREASATLENQDIDILIFDVGLDKRDLSKTSIEFAIRLNEKKPRPTLFYTHYSTRDVPEFFEATQKIEHSQWSSRKGTDWDVDILNNVYLVKRKFYLDLYRRNTKATLSIPFQNRITFQEWRGRKVDHDMNPLRKLFLEKDEIQFITSDRKRNIETFKNAFKVPGEYSVIFTKSKKPIRVGAGIGHIIRQIENYEPIGWNFKRVHDRYIINMDLLEEYHPEDQILKLKSCDINIH
ncbi:MAG: hypothetical protein AAFZ15_16455, partial [Bacteroidota bacterium]